MFHFVSSSIMQTRFKCCFGGAYILCLLSVVSSLCFFSSPLSLHLIQETRRREETQKGTQNLFGLFRAYLWHCEREAWVYLSNRAENVDKRLKHLCFFGVLSSRSCEYCRSSIYLKCCSTPKSQA